MLSGSELLLSLLICAALLLLSIVDLAFTSITKISVRRFLDIPKAKSARLLVALVDRRTEVLMSIHILVQVVIVAGTVFFFDGFERRAIRHSIGIPATLILMFALILILRQLIPRLIVARNPEIVLLRLFPLFKAAHVMVSPFSRLLMGIVNYFHRWDFSTEPVNEEETAEQEIQAFIDAGQEEGILEHDEGEMIQSIVHFGEKVAREVMTPRTQIIAIDIKSTIEELLNLILTKRRTRIPVFREDLDSIEGVIHERDLLRVWQKAEKLDSVRPLVKPVSFIPETKPVDDLLQEMKDKGEHLVMIVDEYGGIAGLVTMDDLVEEIVGDIHDESGAAVEQVIEEAKGVYIVPGSLELSAIEEKLGMPFVDDTECTTVAGAVVELFGRLPAAGEHIEHRGLSIEILDSDRRKVHRLRIRSLVPKTITN